MTAIDALCRLSISEAAPLIASRQLSPLDLTQACIDAAKALDATLHAYLTPTFETALEEAATATEEIAAGRYRGPLHGIPLALKDLFETAGVRTTAGSPLRDAVVPDEDAEVVQRLKQAGAIMLGKLNMHEWALGTTNINAHYPTTRNPRDLTRVTGGSSGGSGAAIAAGLTPGSLGSDTGGSIRIPAALCGITGIKPTYGRVSVRGVIPLAWSLDHVGPMARSAADCALLLQAIAGYDAGDPLSVNAPTPDYAASLSQSISGLQIGIPSGFFFDEDEVEPEIAAAVRAAIPVLTSLGCSVTEIDLGEFVPADDISIFMAEASAYHAERLDAAPESFGTSVLSRLHRAHEFAIEDYPRARLRQASAKRRLQEVFEEVDMILTPTSAVAAPLIPPDTDEASFFKLNRIPSAMLGRNTRPFNITGVPAISIPCGFTASGLPIGLQLAASWWAEATLLRAAHAYQSVTDWHRRFPELAEG